MKIKYDIEDDKKIAYVKVEDVLQAHRGITCCPEDCWCWELEGSL